MAADAFGQAYPALAEALPRIALAGLPTPLTDAGALAERLRIGSLAVKRDDLTSPIYGGNKVRKLEFLLADALARGCDAVATYGAVGSNHALATAVFATRLGLGCHAILVHQPATPAIAPKLRYLLWLGATVHAARGFVHGNEIAAAIRARHPDGARRVADIPWGGSNWIGASGFVVAAFELARQGPAPDFIYLAGGTMGTAVGLALGLRLAGLATRVIAPRAVPSGTGDAARTAQLFTEINRELHSRDRSLPLLDEPLANLELRPEFFGSGYGEATAAGVEAVALMRETQGMDLETTYTGKALAGLVADARAGRLAGKHVVFWNTYNSAPFPAGIATVDLSRLPAEFLPYVERD